MSRNREGRKLSRPYSHRKSLLRNQVLSLFKKERIKTTLPKAKELKKLAEKLINVSKKKELSSIRYVSRYIEDKKVIKKLFDEIAPRYIERNGGYTRVIRVGHRKGDGALVAFIELT